MYDNIEALQPHYDLQLTNKNHTHIHFVSMSMVHVHKYIQRWEMIVIISFLELYSNEETAHTR